MKIQKQAPIDNQFKIKDILSVLPSEIDDIYSVCKNEIQLSNNDQSIIPLYAKI